MTAAKVIAERRVAERESQMKALRERIETKYSGDRRSLTPTEKGLLNVILRRRELGFSNAADQTDQLALLDAQEGQLAEQLGVPA